MSLRKSSRRRNGSKSEVLSKPKARRRCTPAPSRVGLALISRLIGRIDILVSGAMAKANDALGTASLLLNHLVVMTVRLASGVARRSCRVSCLRAHLDTGRLKSPSAGSRHCILDASALLLSHAMSEPGDIVNIRNLSKVYRQGEINVTALNDISLNIASGEFLTLMGPSGSGKSTLLHIIAGIDRPTTGECRVQEIDVTKLNESELADWRNQNVGFVFQTFNLIPVLTAEENVELPLLLTRLRSKERKRQVQTAL